MGSLTTRSSIGRKLCYNYPKPNEGSVLVPDALNEDLFFNLDRATLLMRRQVLDVVVGAVLEELVVTGVDHDEIWGVDEDLIENRHQAVGRV